ncbi:hypothetical protein COO60DRAFT_1625308 [Scenedesmus sp. NREL 46B-D3]|nr:hypothetical protein COO60DRAFT_1625308 [Scenedesmus sp. NREL 46B-D3]
MPNFLSKEDAAAIRKEALSMQPQLRPELNCIAQGRLGCYLGGPGSASVRVFGRRETAAALSQRLRSPCPLLLSEFPIELRAYPKGAAMPWHKDEQMFASPQWEVIYTIDNSSDSFTEWRDDSGREHSLWTEPNSLLAVQAEGWEHRVLPVRKGRRCILKLAFTSSSIKLPAFSANLGREAYAA